MSRPGKNDRTAAWEGKSKRRFSFAAVVSPVVALLGVVGIWIFGSLASILLGVVGLMKIKAAHPPSKVWGRGLAIAGIYIGTAGAISGVFRAGLMSTVLFPAHPAFLNALKRPDWVHAVDTGHQLKNGIAAYHAEYRRYPAREAGGDATLETGEGLMGILLGSKRETGPAGLNPRGIAFFADKTARALESGVFARGIIFDPDGGGVLLDPWGRPYRVRLDADKDDRVENPDPTSPYRILEERILVWSAGPDGDFETWEDNVRCWALRSPESGATPSH